MKKMALVLIGVVLCGSFSAFAQEELGIDLNFDFYSKYIWRGQNLVDGWVFQPSTSLSYKGFTGLVWGNLDMTNDNRDSCEFTEVDLSLDYTGKCPGIDILNYSLGFIYYDFPDPGGVDDTWELYWGLALDVLLNPSVTVYHDVDEADGGAYVSTGVSHSFVNVIELSPDMPVGVDLSASWGWGNSSYNKAYWGVNDSKSQDMALSAAFPIGLGNWTLAPSINYVTLMNDDIRSANLKDSHNLFGGVSLSRSF
ncbi:MAG: hypothetical protein ACYTE8_12615 [Planctomycetota bacterium]|jgi:hypothetical protein